jgi:hypothetical protein
VLTLTTTLTSGRSGTLATGITIPIIINGIQYYIQLYT